ncbi:hypothetical protein HBI52_000430 [Parastagonospora nodorum]|nr:hypothetical protein HBI52_000430 [Parastagonospora nodorum]KAH5697548.1 hypothetical protein HBI44_089210 [Parastagonospora nodorum]KAH6234360.1 hypothetical protein HBI53_022750 [Parastagonospora nodorum]KAH6406137.1 hypothetical protein HBI60_036980 [Parastagonospora nodorum]KAH6550026.1 hypothetical protein HBI07_045910 [Parastagonospora nodorum]
MQSLRRTAVTAARKGRSTLPRQQRRFAHDEHAHDHGHAPVNEPMGNGFWFTFATIPAAWAVWYVSRNNSDDSQPFFTRLINGYTESSEKLAKMNDLHVRMVEQAGEDRVLFNNTAPHDHVEMRFPELMNVGSPYNVPAGSQVSMEKVIEKYKKITYEENERKLEALRNNEVPSEQPLKPRILKGSENSS